MRFQNEISVKRTKSVRKVVASAIDLCTLVCKFIKRRSDRAAGSSRQRRHEQNTPHRPLLRSAGSHFARGQSCPRAASPSRDGHHLSPSSGRSNEYSDHHGLCCIAPQPPRSRRYRWSMQCELLEFLIADVLVVIECFLGEQFKLQ